MKLELLEQRFTLHPFNGCGADDELWCRFEDALFNAGAKEVSDYYNTLTFTVQDLGKEQDILKVVKKWHARLAKSANRKRS